jgi:hypothetical protein
MVRMDKLGRAYYNAPNGPAVFINKIFGQFYGIERNQGTDNNGNPTDRLYIKMIDKMTEYVLSVNFRNPLAINLINKLDTLQNFEGELMFYFFEGKDGHGHIVYWNRKKLEYSEDWSNMTFDLRYQEALKLWEGLYLRMTGQYYNGNAQPAGSVSNGAAVQTAEPNGTTLAEDMEADGDELPF